MSDTPRSDAEVFDSNGIPVSAEDLVANDASLRQQNGGFATYVRLSVARELERELDKEFERTNGWREALERHAEAALAELRELIREVLAASVVNGDDLFCPKLMNKLTDALVAARTPVASPSVESTSKGSEE